MKIYEVPKNLHTVKPIEKDIIRKTDFFYWNKYGRTAIESDYHICFDNIEDALNYIEQILKSNIIKCKNNIESAKTSLVDAEKRLGNFLKAREK